jgi:hypothetical protein
MEDWVAFVPTAVLAAWTGYRAWRTRRFLARAVRTKGRITGYTERETASNGARTHTWYYPHVEFHLEDGTRLEFENPAYEVHRSGVGAHVDVLYERGRPETAHIGGDLAWRSVGKAGCATLVVLTVTLFAAVCG